MGCITLLSDFGLKDATVASAKGVLMQYAPSAGIIDISHQLDCRHPHQAAYLVSCAYRHFPKGTCHLFLFGVMNEPAQRLMLCEYDGHFFLAPDSGILSLVVREEDHKSWQCFTMQEGEPFSVWIHEAAKAAAQVLAHGAEALHFEEQPFKIFPVSWQPRSTDKGLECHVIHIDNFQNVVINITKEQFETHRNGRAFHIRFMRRDEVSQISRNYYDVPDGHKLCRFNSAGYLEIAVNNGCAALLFGFRLQKEHHILYNTIQIEFE